jgi:lipopolysaccharide export system protein LptC
VTEDMRAHLLAKAGIYDANTQKLELSGGISVTTDSGYAGTLDAARVDIEKGTVFTDTGVALEGKEGSITADSLEVLDRGKHIFFRGNVKVRFDPPEETAGADKPAAKDTNESPDAAATDITETRSDGAS